MVIAALVVFALFALVIVFAVVAVSALGAKSEADVLAGGIARGEVPLVAFSAQLFAWMSKDLAGSASYRRPMGGALTGSLAATVLSCPRPGENMATIAAIQCELSPRQGRGRIEVLAGGVKVDLALHQGLWFVTAQGRPLGSIEPTSGRIEDSARGTIGAYRRGGGESLLHLRGVTIAAIDHGATIDVHPAQLRPLLRLPAPPSDGEASLWLLAAIGLDLGLALTPVQGRGSSSGVP